MKVVFLESYKISPNLGGVQRATETLAKEFIKNGIEVFYLALSMGNSETILGVKQYYLPEGKDLSSEKNNLFFKNFIIENKVNIIINQQGFSLPVLYFIKRNIDSNVKIFTVHHNCVQCLNEQYHNIYINTLKEKNISFIFNNGLGWYILKKIHQYRFGKAISKTIQLTDFLVLLFDKFIPELSYYSKNIDVSKIIAVPNPNPFDNVALEIEKKENIVLYVGRLEYGQKRVDRLLKIWEHTYKQFTDWRLEIVGNGPMRNELEEYVNNRNLERVTFHGFCNPTSFYKKAKIFCLTSTFEGYGMVLVEAQHFGVVPISYRCFSSINDIIDNNKTGYIIEEGNFEAYLEKLHILMANSELMQATSSKGAKFVKKFNPKEIAGQWIGHFKNILNEL